MKLKFKSILFIIVGVLLLLPVFIYGSKAFFNFFAVWSTLSNEISFIINIFKFVFNEFFYSSIVMKYITRLFIGVVGFRFFVGLFFDVYRFTNIHFVKDNEDKIKIKKFKEKQKNKLKELKYRKYINTQKPVSTKKAAKIIWETSNLK